MIVSMTGYGRQTFDAENFRIVVEARSLNSKQADIKYRIPQSLRQFELDIKKQIQESLVRGKIDLNIDVFFNESPAPVAVDAPLAKTYHKMLQQLETDLGKTFAQPLEQIMRMPEILKSIEEEALDIDLWPNVQQTIEACLNSLKHFRKEEGMQLYRDMLERIEEIKKLQNQVGKLAPERKSEVVSRLKKALDEFGMSEKADENRFEQELIFYLEKYDITEEMLRLETHCNYFVEVLNSEENQGRKLAFICQEIGREINTIGSKANHSGIQKMVVLMKDELEKIKEQLLNVL